MAVSPLTLLTIGAVTLTAVGTTALAQSRDGDRATRDGRERMHHAQYRRDMRGGHRGARGMGFGMMLMDTYDTNGDRSLTQQEIDAARAAQLAEFDANGDGALTLAEYEALWLDAMRERMVDRFQAHDDDGDGTVTTEEFGEEFADLVTRFDRNGDGELNAEDIGRAERRNPAETPEQ